MKLKNFKKQVVVKVNCVDVEDLIREVYGHSYEIQPMEEVGSGDGAVEEYTVTCDEMINEELSFITDLISGKPEQFILGYILQDLCNKGYIEKGDYLIDVGW